MANESIGRREATTRRLMPSIVVVVFVVIGPAILVLVGVKATRFAVPPAILKLIMQ